ncbi:MAG: Gfo/Idh/MocA family oxidoreductase [Phycisphaerae bacterium]|jgi:predicted dehydrogenase|nr:Gfo/Idh/MocA family oxidoreductase [Phycisphaerae bacterium]MDP7287575.1 Gfo/Idh/MocA family oxidoreductase [Phycisphaerae bacterium]
MEKETSSSSNSMARRTFLKGTAASVAVAAIVPSHVVAKSKNSKAKGAAPSDKVNLAIVGCAARGGSIGNWHASTGLANVTTLCDIDARSLGRMGGKFKSAKKFQDFRQMFDKAGKDFDALTIGVPDHAHFPISMLAMSQGKHIYVEKPLAHTFNECELMIAAMKKYGVATQMGNQGHSGSNPMQFEAWVKAGIIKDITKVDACMNSGRRWHPWKFDEWQSEETPKEVDWDTWLGTAPEHPFSGKLHPGNWRGWFEYGDGAFGDWGPHTLDTIHRYLDCGLPIKTTAVKLEGRRKLIFPMASTIRFDFPQRGIHPALEINWYDGTKNKPPRPADLEKGRNIPRCGKVMYGKDLNFIGGTHSATLSIFPDVKRKELGDKLPRITGKQSNHAQNFLLSAMGKEKTRSSFDISGVLTQMFCLGCIAQRIGGELDLDLKTKQITNSKLGNQLLTGPPPRKGWEQYYKMA